MRSVIVALALMLTPIAVHSQWIAGHVDPTFDLIIPPAGAIPSSQNVTCDGSATNSTSGLIPDGAFLIAVTTKITTALSDATGFSAGDGSDADLYGVQAAATLGSTTDNSDATASFANPQLSAGDVTLTWTTASCTAGVVYVTAYYIQITN